MLYNPYLHYLVARVVDPVGKLISDLRYLNFRRNLLLAISREDDRFALCIHDKCVDLFKRLEFFCVLGRDHDIIEVESLEEAKRHGAHAMLCSCAEQAELLSGGDVVHRADLPGGAAVMPVRREPEGEAIETHMADMEGRICNRNRSVHPDNAALGRTIVQ